MNLSVMRFLALVLSLVGVVAGRAAAPLHFVFDTPEALAGYERGSGFEPGFPVHAGEGGAMGEGAFFFSADVPEGNWRVTVHLVGAAGGSRVTVKAELRRLMVETLVLAPGETATRSFIVNVRNPAIPAREGIAAGMVRLKSPRETTQEAWAWDQRLTLEFNGERPVLRALELAPADVPTIFLLGDSTVCDQSREPYASWGQVFPRFFNAGVAVASHAESGESYRDSIGERRLDKVMTVLRPGDWVLLQFGHNDQKQIAAGTGGPFTTYEDEIKHYIATIKAGGGIPVVISPMERRRFDEHGRIVPSLRDYAAGAKQAAEAAGVAFIDLHAMSIPLYEALGPEKSLAAFAAPGGKLDETHHAAFGAYELAKCVAAAARTQQLGFARFLAADFAGFDPAHPDDPAAFAIPASPLVTNLRPLGD
jgi:lysophospholipase L1-like esterase